MTTQDNPKLKIIQFNVKAGDHTVLEFSDGEIGIIDFHYSAVQNSPPVIQYLKKRIKEYKKPLVIKFLCISHYDIDHVKGLYEFIEFVKEENQINDDSIIIREVWLPPTAFGGGHKKYCLDLMAETFMSYPDIMDRREEVRNMINGYKENLEKSLEYFESNVNYTRAKQFTELHGNLVDNIGAYAIAPADVFVDNFKKNREKLISKFKDDIKAFCKNNPSIEDLKTKLKKLLNGGDENWLSSIIRFSNENIALYFGGDAHLKVWLKSLEDAELKNINFISPDFVKVSHHGSHNSSSVELWEKVLMSKNKSTKVILSISAGKKHNHPASQTLEDIKSVCNQKELHYEICSTNICTYCVTQTCTHNCIIKKDWYESSKHGELTENFMVTQRAKVNKKYYQKGLGLIAYVYEFDVNDSSSEIYKWILSDLGKEQNCVFHSHLNKLYPNSCPSILH